MLVNNCYYPVVGGVSWVIVVPRFIPGRIFALDTVRTIKSLKSHDFHSGTVSSAGQSVEFTRAIRSIFWCAPNQASNRLNGVSVVPEYITIYFEKSFRESQLIEIGDGT